MKELIVNLNDTEVVELKRIFETEDVSQAVIMAVKEVLRKKVYRQILALNGNVKWEGNLDEMREGRL